MAHSARSFSFRLLAGVGMEALPWMGLAAGSFLLPVSTLSNVVPYPRVLISLLILSGGASVIVGRRRWISLYLDETATSSSDRTSSLSSPPYETSSPLSYPTPRSAPNQSQDSLTGLADRKGLLRKISEALEQAPNDPENDDGGPALFTVRINEYRDVTESFGHQAGQNLLTAVASRTVEVCPPTATSARIAEDTFAVLLPEADDDQGRKVGEALLQSFDSPFNIAGHQIPIEASIGLALRPSPNSVFESAEEMLQTSYSAMHQVQRHGENQVNVYQNGPQNDTRRLQRRERLRQAIKDDELILYYQPIVHLVSDNTVGAEALVRWDHPERGILSPAAFIPLAEETGLVGALDRWVFNQALEHASTWTKGTDSPLDWISVNISPQSAEGNLQSWGLQKLSDASLPDGGLHLEITERWALRDERLLQPLRDEGVRLSIDDFGTGYSSLRYLRSLNADVLKIDSEFIQDLGRDEKTTAIVQFLMNLSLRLDVEVIAEGVETTEQENILRDLGCAMAQGYHFSRPVPAPTLTERTESTSPPPQSSQGERLHPT